MFHVKHYYIKGISRKALHIVIDQVANLKLWFLVILSVLQTWAICSPDKDIVEGLL